MQTKCFNEEFSNKVLSKIAYINRIVDDWIKTARMEFVYFLGNLYKPEVIYEVGLNTMKKVLEKTLLEEGEKKPCLLAILVLLLCEEKNPIEVMKYQTIDLDIITLTDVSLIKYADFSSEFFESVMVILQNQFLD